MNLPYPRLFLPFRLSSYSSYLMISLHFLHCVPQSFKCRTIQWVFPPTVKHNLIANREKHIIHHYITSGIRGGGGAGLDPRLFFGRIWSRRSDKYCWQGRCPSNIRLWISKPTYSWGFEYAGTVMEIVLAWQLLFKIESLSTGNFFDFLELSFPYSYYNSQFNLNMFWFWHSVSFLKFLDDFTGIYIRIWRSTWKKWSYSRKKSTWRKKCFSAQA